MKSSLMFPDSGLLFQHFAHIIIILNTLHWYILMTYCVHILLLFICSFFPPSLLLHLSKLSVEQLQQSNFLMGILVQSLE